MENVNFGQFASRTNVRPVTTADVGSQFDYAFHEVSGGMSGGWQKVLEPNPLRFSLIFPNEIASGTMYFAFSKLTDLNYAFTVNSSHPVTNMTFRDYGPIMTQNLWINVQAFSTYAFWELVYRGVR